jgi:hypothetical protein
VPRVLKFALPASPFHPSGLGRNLSLGIASLPWAPILLDSDIGGAEKAGGTSGGMFCNLESQASTGALLEASLLTKVAGAHQVGTVVVGAASAIFW